jgi:hypothetical protein
MPNEKMQPSCPGSRDLNWTVKGLKAIFIVKAVTHSDTIATLA